MVRLGGGALETVALALGLSAGIALMTPALTAPDHEHSSVGEALIQSQREALARSTSKQGFGPQSPRDLNQVNGLNQRVFMQAPATATTEPSPLLS